MIHTLAVDPEIYGLNVVKKMTAYCIDYAKKKHYAALCECLPSSRQAR